MSRVLAAVAGCLCLIGASSVSCSGPTANSGPYRSIEFAVDSTRLGESVEVGVTRLSVPVAWMGTDSTTLRMLRVALSDDTSQYRFEVTNAWIDRTCGAALVGKVYPERGEFLPWARAFIADLRRTNADKDLREEWLLFGTLPGVQIYIADSSRVEFLILLNTQPVTGLDYLVPRGQWESLVRSVEASLGTIRRH